MGEARRIVVEPIRACDAVRIVKDIHYSGRVTKNSQLHYGVFLDGRCGGAMQFGPSIDKRRMAGLVRDTPLDGFLELNRMASADWLPRNSESRAISSALRLIRRAYPAIQWVVSFADAAQCGDGAIYRASGFSLVGIKPNVSLVRYRGKVVAKKSLDDHIIQGRYMSAILRERGEIKPLSGFQLKYIYFLDPSARNRLTVPIIPFSEIERRGAAMYRGQPRAGSIDSDAAGFQPAEGGASPTPALQLAEVVT